MLPLEGLTRGFDIERLETYAPGDAERALWDWSVSCSQGLLCNSLKM